MIDHSKFSSNLKKADIAPIHKKLEKIFAKSYRPVSILPVVSKLLEKILNKQMYDFANFFLSKYFRGYRKNYCTEYALVSMIEKWKKQLNIGGLQVGC